LDEYRQWIDVTLGSSWENLDSAVRRTAAGWPRL